MVVENLMEILMYEVAGDSVIDYLMFLFMLILSYPAAKIVNFIINKYLRGWAQRSKIKFDDIIINSLNPSITMFVFAGFFYVGMQHVSSGPVVPFLERAFNFFLIIPIVYFLIKFTTEMIGFYIKENSSRNKSKANDAAIDLMMSFIKIALFLIGGLLIMQNVFSYNISALLAGLGVGGLAFALAAQDILKNFFSGIAIIFDKTFDKGDKVNFQGNAGIIEEVKLRSTKLRSYDGTLLTIPNAMLSDNIVENVTVVPRVKISMVLGLTYDTSSAKLKKAKEIVHKALKDDKDADETSAWVYFDSFGDFSLNLQVIYFAKKLNMNDWPERIYFKERINFKIKEEFERAGIDMAFPTQTLDIPDLDKLKKK